jgi:predicted ATPase
MNAFERLQYVLEISLNRASIPSFDKYPFSIPAIASLDEIELHPGVTFFIGENGSGKSTLIEAVAIAFGLNPEGGSKHFTFATEESHSELYKYITLRKGVQRPRDAYFLRAESFYNVATNINELGVGAVYGRQPLHQQSHGEAFMSLFLNRFRGKGLYILDEPEAALSPVRQFSLISRIHQLVAKNSQFIIATHSPILLAYPNSYIYHIDGATGIRRMAYEATEHFRMTKYFLNNYHSMLNELMKLDE